MSRLHGKLATVRGALWAAMVMLGGACAASADGPVEDTAVSDRALPALPDGLHPSGASGESPERCASCHAEIVREWRGSFHRASFTNPWFAAAYASEPRTFCRSCHAPGPESDGISCAACHGAQPIVSSGRHAPTRDHDTIADARFATSAVCAGCHEFTFQSHADGEPSAPLMQSTCSEARDATASCQTCHMPFRTDARGRRYRSHAFDGTSRAMLSHALAVHTHATRIGDDVEVTFTLRSKSGHAVPTGDLFRALELTVTAGEARATKLLARSFRYVDGRDDDGHVGLVRRDARDLRVFPSTDRVVTLRVRAAPGSALHWTIAHLRTNPAAAANDGVDVGRTVFLNGSISPL